MTDHLTDLKRQLKQLDELAQTGVLPGDVAAKARAELEQRVVAAVMAQPDASPSSEKAAPGETQAASARPSQRLIWGLAAFVLVFGAAGYAWRGSSAAWSTPSTAGASTGSADAAAPGPAASAPHAMTSAQIEGMVSSLAERLKTSPDDAEGWLMLGRSYAVLGKFTDAIPAYRKVLKLDPRNAQAMADLADALAMNQGRSFKGEPSQLIAAALKSDPDNLKALSLAGTLAFEAKDYQGALTHWERGAKSSNVESELVKRMRENAAEARQLAGLPASEAPGVRPSGGADANSTVSISGRVELAPALAAKAKPDDIVFVFARPAGGSRMPLAILKKRVRDLPFEFTLNDSLAMSPSAKLSQASDVVVGARISPSGQAMPQAGDLQGSSSSVKVGTAGLTVVIAEEVR